MHKNSKVRPRINRALILTARADNPVDDALLEALLKLLAIARGNQEEIGRNPKSLHDYRVALRKMRTLLGVFKNIFRVPARAKRNLARVFRQTNRLRDLDVHWMSRRSLEQKIPHQLQDALDLFFQELEKMRNQESRRLSQYIQSDDYQKVMTSIEWDLSQFDSLQNVPSIRKAALQMIAKRFERICKTGHRIKPTSPNSTIHKTRIRLKKLRYLIDVFGQYFESKQAGRLTRKLQQLQDALGHFNDSVVLQKFFLNQAHNPSHYRNPKLLVSLGALIGALHQEHFVLRDEVVRKLRKFCRSKNVRRIRLL